MLDSRIWFAIVCLLPAFAVSYLATAAMRVLSPRWGLVDQPAARKFHRTSTPLGGGIAIWLGVVLPLAAAQAIAFALSRTESPEVWIAPELAVHLDGVWSRAGLLWGILAAGTLLSVMGLLDDLFNLPWVPRLLVQICVACGLVAGGVHATLFVPWPMVGAVVTALWIIVLINSINFLDNMDGLTSGISLIAACMFAIIMLTSTSEPRWLVAGVLLVLAGSLAGFLGHNWPPARSFMGDTGSYFVGLLLATMTVLGTFYESNTGSRHVMLAPLCVLAVPLYDFITVVSIRLSRGLSPFHADKNHFSHRLVDLGFTSRNAVLTIHLATLTTGLGGLLLYRVPDWSSAWLVIALIACVLAMIAILETVARHRTQQIQNQATSPETIAPVRDAGTGNPPHPATTAKIDAVGPNT